MATKIYIAGKITGDPDYKAKFEEAENFYKKKEDRKSTRLNSSHD